MGEFSSSNPFPSSGESANFRLAGRRPLVLSRVHWVRPELVVEVTYLTWTDDGLLRQVVYEGLREDKPAREVTRPPAGTETFADRKF
jgi:ATP-dependent DNA ligase